MSKTFTAPFNNGEHSEGTEPTELETPMKTNSIIEKKPSKYLILEKGSYDDYKVAILDVTDCNLKNKEILTLLNCDRWSDYSISGGIIGEVKKCNCLNLLDEATSGINAIFSCYDNREYKTVLDKKYSRDELLKIATSNDNSGLAYWKREIDNKYDTYIECFDIYKKLLKGN